MNYIVNRKVKGETMLLLFNASDICFYCILFHLILTKDLMIRFQFNEGGSRGSERMFPVHGAIAGGMCLGVEPLGVCTPSPVLASCMRCRLMAAAVY